MGHDHHDGDGHGHGHGHAHGHGHGHGPPTYDGDARIAKDALAAGDVKHAVEHVAGAYGLDPLAAERDLLDALLAADGDAIRFVPPQGLWYGTALLRAALLRRKGDASNAVGLALQVLPVKQDLPIETLVDGWLDAATLAELDPTPIRQPAVGLVRDDGLAARVAPLLRKLVDAHPTSDALAFAASKAFRVRKEYDVAMSIARRTHDAAPSYTTAIAIAGVARASQDWTMAVTGFREALKFAPDDVGARLDIGDLSMDELHDLPAAIAAYEEVLDLEPGEPWASASVLYARWKHTGGAQHRAELESLARKDPNNHRATALLAKA